MAHARFATAINCMDGRAQLPVIEFLRQRYDVDYVDMITAPGVVGILADDTDARFEDFLKRSLKVSIEKHGSHLIAVIAHHDCAGNPVDRRKQIEQTKAGIEKLKSWGLDAELVGLWIDRNWKVYEIS
jgi:carbonic anhydrase